MGTRRERKGTRKEMTPRECAELDNDQLISFAEAQRRLFKRFKASDAEFAMWITVEQSPHLYG